MVEHEQEWDHFDRRVRNLLEEYGSGGRHLNSDGAFLQALHGAVDQELGHQSRKEGGRFLDLVWKTVQHDIPHRLDKRTELNFLVGLSRTHDLVGNWRQALDWYERALNLARKLREREIEVSILRWMGHLHRKLGNWNRAIELNEESLELCRRIHDPRGEAYALNNMGTISFEMGEWKDAQRYFLEAREIAVPLQETKLVAQIDNNTGVIANVRSDYEEAVRAYHRAILGYEKEGDIRGMAQSHYNLAIVFEDVGNRRIVRKHLERSAELAREIGEKNMLAMIYLRKALLFAERDDFVTAHSLSDIALSLFEDLGVRMGVADSYRAKGVILHRQKKYDESEKSFRKSVELNNALGSSLTLADVHLDYGRLLVDMKREEAINSFHKAEEIYERYDAVKKLALLQGLKVKLQNSTER